MWRGNIVWGQDLGFSKVKYVIWYLSYHLTLTIFIYKKTKVGKHDCVIGYDRGGQQGYWDNIVDMAEWNLQTVPYIQMLHSQWKSCRTIFCHYLTDLPLSWRTGLYEQAKGTCTEIKVSLVYRPLSYLN